MTTIRFEPVAVRRRLVGKCPVCGKRGARSREDSHRAGRNDTRVSLAAPD